MFRISLVLLLVTFSTERIASQQCQLAQICVTDLSQSDCASNTELVPNTAIDGCCPSCQTPPETVEETTECQSPSNCLPNGKYAPVQCKGDMFTGRCFCSDEDGNRIFGQMWRDQAADMTCACSRHRAELEKSGRGDVSLHCTTSGDYEVLQCDDGICWCAQPKTGQPTVHPVPEVDMKLLPCLSEEMREHCGSLSEDITGAKRAVTFCDYDGSYGPFQIQNGIAYCTGRDGDILGAWQTMANEIAGMNCNCARDTMIHFPARGMQVTEVCTGFGNYRPNQQAGDVFYCVDTDGYLVGELGDAWPDDNCARYA